jgi:hypothetical protein
MAEQIVNLRRQVEVVVANGKTLSQACKEARSWSRRTTGGARCKGGLEDESVEETEGV